MPVASMIAGGVAAVSGITKIIKGAHQNKLANGVVIPDATYQSSPYAQAMMDQANEYKNSRMTGAANAEQNIMSNQGNTIGAIDRNATSGAQALAMVSAAQGQTNQAFNGLRQHEGADQQMKMNNWNQANQQMIGEGDKVFNDKVRKQQQAISEKNNLRGAANANFSGALNDFSNGAMGAASIAAGTGNVAKTN